MGGQLTLFINETSHRFISVNVKIDIILNVIILIIYACTNDIFIDCNALKIDT